MANDATPNGEGLESFFERMTDTYVEALNQNLDAQAAFVDSWMDSMETTFEEETIEEGYEGTARAYEAWMNAAETSFDRVGDVLEGESVDPEEFRDIWLNAANKAFKESMATTAFAAATGQHVDDALDMRQQLDEAAEETLHNFGFASVGDVQEVGKRLVELERRQQSIENKLDRLLDEE